MFVPLEPNQPTGLPGQTDALRIDPACLQYPAALHFSSTIAPYAQSSLAVETQAVSVQWTSTRSNATGSPEFTSISSAITQIDASLQASERSIGSSCFTSQAPSEAAGVYIDPIVRTDSPHAILDGPHSTSPVDQPTKTSSPKRKNAKHNALLIDGHGPVSHSAAPLHLIEPALDPAWRSPTDKFSLLQAIGQHEAGRGGSTTWSWNQGLVESSRRRDWIWPKIVDELIGRQWVAVDQLGRTALGNSREETRRILVTSTRRGEGRTTIALAIARWAAMTGNRTLLVDADKNHPGIAPALNIQATGDWRKTSLAFGVENSLVTCRSLPLSLLPLSPDPSLSTASVSLEQLIVQLAVAEQEFDCCVIDGAPISELCDQIATVTRLSSSIVVVNDDKHGAPQSLIAACNLLWQRGKPAMAIADNFRR